jgi:hypothetical protein
MAVFSKFGLSGQGRQQHTMNTDDSARLDRLVRRLLSASPYRFTVAALGDEADVAFRLRYEAVVARGWLRAGDLEEGAEHDSYDERAVHVIAWAGDEPIATGRIVLPPGPLPTEAICGLVVEPRGEVVDVGRILVSPAAQDPSHHALRALLAYMYLEVRQRGFTVACGMMAAPVRALCRQLGLTLERLGDDREFFHELRAPVRFDLAQNVTTMTARWGDTPATGSAGGGRHAEHEARVGATESEGVRQTEAGTDGARVADDDVGADGGVDLS